MVINELICSKNEFLNMSFDFIVGENATYNHYYEVYIDYSDKHFKIGLQGNTAGIDPQAIIYSDAVLIGIGSEVYVYDFNGIRIKTYHLYSTFYQFIKKNSFCLVVGEIEFLLLDKSFNVVWKRVFNDIMSFEKIYENLIFLKDYSGKRVVLSYDSEQILNI